MMAFESIDQIDEMIRTSEMCLIYFSGTSCKACEIIRRKVENLLDGFPKVASGFINAEEHPEVTGPFQVYTVPLFSVYVRGKETIREGKYVDFRDLESRITRYFDLI